MVDFMKIIFPFLEVFYHLLVIYWLVRWTVWGEYQKKETKRLKELLNKHGIAHEEKS